MPNFVIVRLALQIDISGLQSYGWPLFVVSNIIGAFSRLCRIPYNVGDNRGTAGMNAVYRREIRESYM